MSALKTFSYTFSQTGTTEVNAFELGPVGSVFCIKKLYVSTSNSGNKISIRFSTDDSTTPSQTDGLIYDNDTGNSTFDVVSSPSVINTKGSQRYLTITSENTTTGGNVSVAGCYLQYPQPILFSNSQGVSSANGENLIFDNNLGSPCIITGINICEINGLSGDDFYLLLNDVLYSSDINQTDGNTQLTEGLPLFMQGGDKLKANISSGSSGDFYWTVSYYQDET